MAASGSELVEVDSLVVPGRLPLTEVGASIASRSRLPLPLRPTTYRAIPTRTEWHRVYAWGNLANFVKSLQKGQLISLEGKIKYRAIEENVKGQQVKYTIAEIHASSIRRLSKVEAADDPSDGADEA